MARSASDSALVVMNFRNSKSVRPRKLRPMLKLKPIQPPGRIVELRRETICCVNREAIKFVSAEYRPLVLELLVGCTRYLVRSILQCSRSTRHYDNLVGRSSVHFCYRNQLRSDLNATSARRSPFPGAQDGLRRGSKEPVSRACATSS